MPAPRFIWPSVINQLNLAECRCALASSQSSPSWPDGSKISDPEPCTRQLWGPVCKPRHSLELLFIFNDRRHFRSRANESRSPPPTRKWPREKLGGMFYRAGSRVWRLADWVVPRVNAMLCSVVQAVHSLYNNRTSPTCWETDLNPTLGMRP